MVIASFHRTLTIVFHVLFIVAVMAIMIGFAVEVSDKNGWIETMGAWGLLAWLIIIPASIILIVDVLRQPRAIWIADGKLHFFRSVLHDVRFFALISETVPLDTIAGVSSVRAGYPGIYVNLKSGGSYRVSTFLLRESSDAVIAHLHEALTPMLVKA